MITIPTKTPILPLYHQIIDHYDDLKYLLLQEQTFDNQHYGFSEFFYKIMETDQRRVAAFQKAFAHYNFLQDKVVCEAGVGRLALSKLYLPYVKKAYLIESNPNLIAGIKAEIAKNNWTHKVELIHGDALKVTLPEPVDYVIGELMSIFCANEYQVPIFKHLRKFLKPNGKLIPEKIYNLVQLGNATFEHGYTHYPLLFTRHWPELLSQQVVLNTTDLYKVTRRKVRKKVTLKNYLTGIANCALLYSFVQLAEGINFTGTDSLMPPTVLQLATPTAIQAQTKTLLKVAYTYGTSLDDALFDIE